MKLHVYKDYEEYKAIQSPGNKLNTRWANERNIEFAANYLLSRTEIHFGICHGSRFGDEQGWFAKFLPGARVIGTDIGEQYHDIAATVVWDFHQFNPEWAGADFIYSNALDHAREPQRAISTWSKTLNPGGVLVIEHTSNHDGIPTPLDPFRASLAELLDLLPQWSGLPVIEVLDTPFRYPRLKYSKFIIVGRDA